MSDKADVHRAAYKFVEEMVPRADQFDPSGAPLWYGWALREAFLAGHERAQSLLFLKDKAVSDYLFVNGAMEELDR